MNNTAWLVIGAILAIATGTTVPKIGITLLVLFVVIGIPAIIRKISDYNEKATWEPGDDGWYK